MVDMKRESPLVDCRAFVTGENVADENDIATIGESPFLGFLLFRAEDSDNTSIEIVQDALGAELPRAANRVLRTGANVSLWLGPNEWLIVRKDEFTVTEIHRLRQLLAQRHAAVTDVSSGNTLVFVRGSHSRELLARGCPLDLDAASFTTGDCAQSHFDHIPITLWLDTASADPQALPWINIVVRRSFADYFCDRLIDSAASLRRMVTDRA